MNTYHGSCHCGRVKFITNTIIDYEIVKFDGRNWEESVRLLNEKLSSNDEN